MAELKEIQQALQLGETLAISMPQLDPQQSAAPLPVAGAATRAMKWLGDEIVKLLARIEDDDCEGFIEIFKDVERRACALEPVVRQLRPRWEAAQRRAADAPDEDNAQGHIGHYQRCRRVIFTTWAAACPKKVRAAADAHHGAVTALDPAPLKAHWHAVRAALQALQTLPAVDFQQFHATMEAELKTITGAPCGPAVARPKSDDIPKEHLSRAIGRAEAARLHSGSNVADPAAYFRALVERKLMKPPIVNGRSWQFDVRDFPASKRELLR